MPVIGRAGKSTARGARGPSEVRSNLTSTEGPENPERRLPTRSAAKEVRGKSQSKGSWVEKREGGDLIRHWVEFNGALTSKMSPGPLRVSAFDPLQKVTEKESRN